jgi:hydrogenase maturation protease
LGQAAAGDDGVGFAVLEEIRRRGVPAGVELMSAADSTVLFALLETTEKVVLVDAALGATPGRVLQLEPDELAERGLVALSSHGIGVGQVIGLARLLSPERISPSVCIVAVTIARPDRYRSRLSCVVAGAVARAADRVLELVGASDHEPCAQWSLATSVRKT